MRTDKNYTPADVKGADAYNIYYLRVADRYRLFKWLLLLLFTVYLLFMMLLHRESITQENFAYLLRDFNVSAVADGGFASVVYEERQNMTFASFKGELAVASMSEIALYNGMGTASLKDSTDCRNPVLDAGDKYLLLYDEGGTSYALYTAIACVKQGKTESIIQTAAISDSGTYAITTRSRESKYTVSLYSASFREIARYYRDTYVTDVSLNANGDQLAILSTSQDQSVLHGTLTLCMVGSDSVVDIPLGSHLPLKASYLADGTLAVILEDGVRFFNADGTQRAIFSFSSVSLSSMHISDTKVAVACREDTLGTQSRVYVLGSDGTLLADIPFEQKILSVMASDEKTHVYVCTQDAVWTASETNGKAILASYSGKLVSLCEIGGAPIFCFASGAQSAAAK